MDAQQVFEEVKMLELALLDTKKRKNPAFLDDVLDDDFIEIGSSGRVYDKSDVMAVLVGEDYRAPDVQGFQFQQLSADIIQIRYETVRMDGTLKRCVRRSSLWKKSDADWVMIFHQGTVVI